MSRKITGIDTLDEILESALPEGYTILVYGPPGAGLEVFAKQFAGVEGRDTTYIATDEDTDTIKSTLQYFGWDHPGIRIVNFGKEYYEKVLARRLEISRYREEGIKVSDIKRFTASAWKSERPVNFLTKLVYETGRLPRKFRLVVDSLNFFVEHYSYASVLSALRTIRAHAQHVGGEVLYTIHGNVYQHTLQTGVESLVDCLIELETIRTSEGFERNLILHKVTNHPELTGVFKYTIGKSGFVVEK